MKPSKFSDQFKNYTNYFSFEKLKDNSITKLFVEINHLRSFFTHDGRNETETEFMFGVVYVCFCYHFSQKLLIQLRSSFCISYIKFTLIGHQGGPLQ